MTAATVMDMLLVRIPYQLDLLLKVVISPGTLRSALPILLLLTAVDQEGKKRLYVMTFVSVVGNVSLFLGQY